MGRITVDDACRAVAYSLPLCVRLLQNVLGRSYSRDLFFCLTALVVFSKCLSEFPKNNLMESEVFTQNEKRCEAAWKATGQPEMRTRRGNFQVSDGSSK